MVGYPLGATELRIGFIHDSRRGRSRGMTHEEAIAYLKRADVTVGREIKTKTAEALEMGIKALEQEHILDKIRAEIEQEPYVSKMEVLEIIDKYKTESEEGAEE